MSEVNAQTPENTPTAEDLSRAASAPSATELAPVDSTQQPEQPPQEANADLQPEPLPDGKTGDAVDTNDYEAEKAAYLAGKKNPAPAPEPTPAAPPAPEASPAPPPAAPAQTDEGDELKVIKAADGKFSKQRIRPTNEGDAALLLAYRAAQETGSQESLSDFIVRQKAPTPSAPVTPPADATTPNQPTPESKKEFTSFDEMRAEISRLTDLEYERQGAFDLEGAKAAREAVTKLMLELPDMHERITSQAATAAAAQERAWNESLGKAQQVFGDAGKAGTPLEATAAAVRAEWVANGHPLAFAADSALALYAEAAARINQTAATAAPRSQPVPTPSPVHRPPLSPLIGGGDARTQQTQRAPDISQTPLSDYESEKEAFLNRSKRGSGQLVSA